MSNIPTPRPDGNRDVDDTPGTPRPEGDENFTVGPAGIFERDGIATHLHSYGADGGVTFAITPPEELMSGEYLEGLAEELPAFRQRATEALGCPE